MSDLQFVPSDGTDKDNQKTRKAIRRHVMLGKNRGRAPKNPKPPNIVGASVFKAEEEQDPGQSVLINVPARVGSDLSSLQLADEVHMSLKHATIRFCTTMNNNLFMLEPCIALDAADSNAMCMQGLMCDALYLNAMVFGAQICINMSFQRSTSQAWIDNPRQGMRHYGKLLRLLNERLASLDGQPSVFFDSAILAVYTLAMHALISGDLRFARSHVHELSRLVSLRPGGFQAFRHRPKQLIELMRCDLSIALASGEAPLLRRDFGIGALKTLETTTVDSGPVVNQPEAWISQPDLQHIWQTLRSFCALANSAVTNSSKITEATLLDTMASTMYHLTAIPCLHHTLHDVVRLSLMAICSKLFLQWPMLRLSLPWLQPELEQAIRHMLNGGFAESHTYMLLWAVLTYGIAFSPLEPGDISRTHQWLACLKPYCDFGNWDAIKQRMSHFIWIHFVCDGPAERLLRDYCSKHKPSAAHTAPSPILEGLPSTQQ